jgi:hypothetical protein
LTKHSLSLLMGTSVFLTPSPARQRAHGSWVDTMIQSAASGLLSAGRALYVLQLSDAIVNSQLQGTNITVKYLGLT